MPPKPLHIINPESLDSLAAAAGELQRLTTEGLGVIESLDGQDFAATGNRPAQTVGIMDNMKGAITEVTIPHTGSLLLNANLKVMHLLNIQNTRTGAPAPATPDFLPVNVRWQVMGWQFKGAPGGVGVVTCEVGYVDGVIDENSIELRFYSAMPIIAADPLIVTMWFHPIVKAT